MYFKRNTLFLLKTNTGYYAELYSVNYKYREILGKLINYTIERKPWAIEKWVVMSSTT